jgi:hypothetical protein
VDIINLGSNRVTSEYFTDILPKMEGIPVELFASPDTEMERMIRERNMKSSTPWIITFTRLFSDTAFIEDIGSILRILQDAYEYPVDIEFTLNFDEDRNYRINLLQCRPYQTLKATGAVKELDNVQDSNIVLKTHGPIIGSSMHRPVDRIIYVSPKEYGKLSERDRHGVAAVVGKIANLDKRSSKSTMLIGPGRWGTTTPSLGVPVKFSAINNVSVLCEIAEMHEGLIPDVSLGTHFFNDLVELDILYMAVYPEKDNNVINREFLNSAESRLEDIYPEDAKWSDVVRVIELPDSGESPLLYLNVNTVEQEGLLYLDSS